MFSLITWMTLKPLLKCKAPRTLLYCCVEKAHTCVLARYAVEITSTVWKWRLQSTLDSNV